MSEKKKLADKVLERLQGFAETLERGESVAKRYTVRTVELDLKPINYGADEVRRVRERLGLSQALLAEYLGVSVKTVQSWEQGKPVPRIAARFLDELHRNPRMILDRVRQRPVEA